MKKNCKKVKKSLTNTIKLFIFVIESLTKTNKREEKKMACWNTKTEERQNEVVIRSGDRSNSYYGKFWVAKINGTHPKWGLDREFINDREFAIIPLDVNGIYQIFRTCQWAKRAEEYFIVVSDGKCTRVEDKAEIIMLVR